MSVSETFQPGDLVECLCNRTPETLPPRGLVVGGIYTVDAVGVTPPEDVHPNVAWVRLRECPPRPGKLGFRKAWFRLIHRPDATLIEGLIALPEKLTEVVPA